jgi:hypothetical protein
VSFVGKMKLGGSVAAAPPHVIRGPLLAGCGACFPPRCECGLVPRLSLHEEARLACRQPAHPRFHLLEAEPERAIARAAGNFPRVRSALDDALPGHRGAAHALYLMAAAAAHAGAGAAPLRRSQPPDPGRERAQPHPPLEDGRSRQGLVHARPQRDERHARARARGL